jgi:hypothetical protein
VEVDALIFAGVAAAWAIYLIPKALAGHDDARRAQPIDGFSDSMRVVARREPTDDRSATLVVGDAPARVPPATEAELRALAAALSKAARRRRRTVEFIVVLGVAVVAVAAAGVVSWWYSAVPAGVLAGWLTICRFAVRAQNRRRAVVLARLAATAEIASLADEEMTVALDVTSLAAVVTDRSLWDPVPITLPTYVAKAAAPRTVRTINLGSDDVWTSGRAAADGNNDVASRPVGDVDDDPGQQRAVGS